MIILKTRSEIEIMRATGRILARVLRVAGEHAKPGISTDELDVMVYQMIADAGGVPSFLNYKGFPKSACISVNEEVVHGIPGGRILKEGDVVGIDAGIFKDGYHVDSAWTFPVGEISDEATKLLRVTQESLKRGIDKARSGNRVGDIAAAVQKHCEAHGFGVVRDLVGHGIGKTLHEAPSVPNFGKSGTGPKLKEGMTICIEPMVNLGTWKVRTLADDWTIVTADGRYSAHFEHTIAVTDKGPEILTQED